MGEYQVFTDVYHCTKLDKRVYYSWRMGEYRHRVTRVTTYRGLIVESQMLQKWLHIDKWREERVLIKAKKSQRKIIAFRLLYYIYLTQNYNTDFWDTWGSIRVIRQFWQRFISNIDYFTRYFYTSSYVNEPRCRPSLWDFCLRCPGYMWQDYLRRLGNICDHTLFRDFQFQEKSRGNDSRFLGLQSSPPELLLHRYER